MNVCIKPSVCSEWSSTGLNLSDLKIGISHLCGVSEGNPFQLSITRNENSAASCTPIFLKLCFQNQYFLVFCFAFKFP